MLILTLLAGITALSLASKCERVWWESAVIYQVYVRSFKDSNGDGIGDLKGIIDNLEYFKQTGVDAIWLSPINLSPMNDFGYDITDFKKISPQYGTLKIFDQLITKSKEIGLRVILDYVPNHTSNDSEWFIKSINRDPQYEDYYIWEDGKPDPDNPGEMLPPCNWLSVFGGSAWEYNDVRKQYYYHQFLVGQPDLNFRNPKVQKELKAVFRFYLDRGVSGFRVDAVNFLFEANPKNYNGSYPDEPPSGMTGISDYDSLKHIYTRDRDENFGQVFVWRNYLNEYTKKTGKSILMITEAYSEFSKEIRYYGGESDSGALPFNFEFLIALNNNSDARDLKRAIDKWLTNVPCGKIPNWVSGNHDRSRVGNRFGTNRIDAVNMLALVLPGITFTYQGEEIGMTDAKISYKDTKDPQACLIGDPYNYSELSRDPERSPFQWNDSRNAGFSDTKGEPWLPVAENYREVNLAAEKNAFRSHYKFYKDVAAIKKLPTVRYGQLQTNAINEDVIVVARMLPDHPSIVAITNLSKKKYTINLNSFSMISKNLQVLTSGVDCKFNKGEIVSKEKIVVTKYCSVVFRTIRNCC